MLARSRRVGQALHFKGEEPAVTSHTDVRNVLSRCALILSPLSRAGGLFCSLGPGSAACCRVRGASSLVLTVGSVSPPGVDHRFTKQNAARETLNLYHVSQSVTNIPE